jgi:4-amino-4-deoxy-L-arabinose transferase-like glycosyltransferase
LFITLAFGTILTKRPWIDEAWFASPGLDLAEHGRMGTHILEPTGSHLSVLRPGARLDGIDRHTYWVMPMHFLVLALTFKILGFSLAVDRLPALLWGLGALAAWYVIVRRLGGSRQLATLTLLFVGVDYSFVDAASDGRMDMMCAALGFIAMAIYLALRESRFLPAVLLSHTAAALGLFTHPNGMFAAVALVFMVLYLDRKRLSWAVAPLTAAPYLAAGLAWFAYIQQDRAAFAAQFGANASNRMAGLTAPLESIRMEIARRYLGGHFLPSNSAFGNRLKVLILVAYLAALVIVIATPALRSNPGYRLLLYLTGLRFLMMAWGASLKEPYYLVHIIPFYAFFLACAAFWYWQRSQPLRWATAAVLCVVLALQVSWSLQRILWLRPYQTQYLPAIRFLREHMTPQDLVCGSADLAFGLGFDNPQIMDDLWMGRWSGRLPTIVVVDRWYYNSTMVGSRNVTLGYYSYVTQLLHDQYHEIYSQPDRYQIYGRNPPTTPSRGYTANQSGPE